MAILPVLLTLLLMVAAPAGAAVRRTPTQAPTNTVIDGPSADIRNLSGLFVARDGTGGIAYLKNVGGVAHVFVSMLAGGDFGAPHQIDADLGGASSQPVISGDSGGELMVAFINGGTLYTVHQPNALAGWQGPQAIAGGASNPALSMNDFSKAYLAYTAGGSGGSDVRAAYFDGQWSPTAGVLDAAPGDRAGSGTGRPRVVACGDGTGVVAWGEAGHIYARRVLDTSPSVNVYRADPGSVQGASEVSADSPELAAGGDSSYVSVVFRETVSSGGARQTRVIWNHLIAGRFVGALPVDGLAGFGVQSADQPGTATTEFGAGFATAEQSPSHDLYALKLSGNENPKGVGQINSQPELTAPDAVSSAAGTVSTMIAWQQETDTSAAPEIRLRYAPDGSNLNPEQVVSSSSLGPTDADLGLGLGGDLAGDGAVAWVQGSGDSTRILAAQLYQSPGGFSPSTVFSYARTINPVLSWSSASELWGSPTYQVKMDGTLVAQTNATSIAVPAPLTQGRHNWQVTAINAAATSTVDRVSTVLVDTLPPTVKLRVRGKFHPKVLLHAFVRAYDTRPGLPGGQVSGVSHLQVRWGDGSKPLTRATTTHRYRRTGRFTLTITATDRAGNRTVVKKKIRVVPVPKKKKKKGKNKAKHPIRHRERR